MKSKALLLVSVLAVSGLVSLASCGETVEESLYKVTAEAGSGTTISFKDNVTEYHKGDMVTFTVAVTSTDSSQELKTVKFGDTSLAIESDGTYEVAMPDKNVTVTTAMGPVEVTDFKVTTKAGLGSTITLTAGEVTSFAPGSTVEFDVAVENPDTTVLDSVLVGGNEVSGVDGHYTFTMPNKDVEIETVTTVLGDGSLLTPSDVDETVVAKITNIETLTTFLNEEVAVAEETVLTGGHEELSSNSSSEASYAYDYEVGRNDVSVKKGWRTDSLNAEMNKYVYEVKGLYDDSHYYSINSDSTSAVEVVTLGVVEDTEGYVDPNENIEQSDAENRVATAGFTQTLLGYVEDFDDTIPVTSLTDAKHFTVELDYLENYYGFEYIQHSLSMTFDGDNALVKASYSSKTYDSDDYDETSESIVSGATPTEELSYSLVTERGYRKDVTPELNIEDFVASDYEVIGRFNSTNYVEEGGNVDNGQTLSFLFRSKDEKSVKVTPRIVEVKSDVEEIGTLNGTESITLQKEGDFTVVFDNGIGELKEVSYKSVRPNPRTIAVELSAPTMFVGNSITLSTKVSPEEAVQDVTVTLKEDSACEATIAKNEDGTFTVTGTTAGAGTLVVASTQDPSINTEVSFEVVEKPTLEELNTFFTSNTLYHTEAQDHRIYVNFNEDLTGEFRYDEFGWYSFETGEVVNFTYSIDAETLAVTFEITGEQTTSSDYNLVGFNILSGTSVQITVDYFGEDTYVLEGYGSKIDLNA